MHRSIASRKAATPKYRSEIQSLTALQLRVSCRPAVGEVDLAVARLGVLEEVERDLEAAAQLRPVPDEERAELDRLVEPLVGVERDRVGELEPGESLATSVGEACERSVGAVDVQPDAVLAADLGELSQRIDRSDRGRAGICHDDERRQSGHDVGGDGRPERIGPHSRTPVGRDHAYLVGPESERPCRARERRVRLVGQVQDRALVHRADPRLARAGERRQVRDRAPGDEHSRRSRLVADPLADPVEHDELEHRRPRGAEPPARVEIEGARDQVAERPGHVPSPGMNARYPGWLIRATNGRTSFSRSARISSKGAGLLGRRARQLRAQVIRARRPDDGARWPGQAVDEHVDRPVAELAHHLRIEAERRAATRRHTQA